jgi:penicillin-binding protein 1A
MVDSSEFEVPVTEETPEQPVQNQEVITPKPEEQKPAEPVKQPATAVPLTKKEERQLKRKQKQEEKEREKNNNN